MMPLTMLYAFAVAHLHQLRREMREDGERGDIVQTVIIIAAFAAASILIVAILVKKATDAANNVQTQ